MVVGVWARILTVAGECARSIACRPVKDDPSVADDVRADIDVESVGSVSVGRSNRLVEQLRLRRSAIEALGDWLPGGRAE